MLTKTLYGKLLVTLLIGIHLMGVFHTYMPLIEYKVNYNFISTVLCINKTNETLDCNGKCYLKKEIEKAAKETSDEQRSGSSLELIAAFLEKETDSLIRGRFEIASSKKFVALQSIYHSLSSEISSPPPRF